ncbi:MAG: rRNA maturation RNAse YbeY [Candidatus Colwellbacteria bacterium]|nr:rRNA maturation RNAse YbeY [Candidatus Colwellbacteria bacterium]
MKYWENVASPVSSGVTVVAVDRRYRSLVGRVKRCTERALARMGRADARIELYLVGSSKMRSNVLAFEPPKNFPQHRGGGTFLGEVYLNPTYIQNQGEELDYMALHGILHLVGYDHRKAGDRIGMEQKERELLHG